MSDAAYLVGKLALLERGRIPLTSIDYLGAHLTIGCIDFLQAPLAPEESSFVRSMSNKRRREFIAGRTAARLSMLRAGHSAEAVARQAGGAPIWPDGLSGSLSHNDRFAGAAVIRANLPAPIGIDIEDSSPLPDDLLALVLTPAELGGCSGPKSGGANIRAKLLFSAKEAVFKADWPRYGEFLDFADIELSQMSEAALIGVVHATGNRRKYVVNAACSEQTIITLSRSILCDEDRR